MATGQSTYRCLRTRAIYATEGIVAAFLFSVLGLSFANQTHNPRATPTAWAMFVFAALSVWFVVRGLHSSTIKVFPEHLEVQGVTGMHKYSKSDIAEVTSIVRVGQNSPLKFQTPKIEMVDGSSLLLREFSVRPAKPGAATGDGVEQIIMVLELSEWLSNS